MSEQKNEEGVFLLSDLEPWTIFSTLDKPYSLVFKTDQVKSSTDGIVCVKLNRGPRDSTALISYFGRKTRCRIIPNADLLCLVQKIGPEENAGEQIKLPEIRNPFNANEVSPDNFEGFVICSKDDDDFYAIQLIFPEGFWIDTDSGIANGEPGDYLVIDSFGFKRIVPQALFSERYVIQTEATVLAEAEAKEAVDEPEGSEADRGEQGYAGEETSDNEPSTTPGGNTGATGEAPNGEGKPSE